MLQHSPFTPPFLHSRVCHASSWQILCIQQSVYALCFNGLCVRQYYWNSLRLSVACTLSHTNKIDAIWKHVKFHISAYNWKVHHVLYLTEYVFVVYVSHQVHPFICSCALWDVLSGQSGLCTVTLALIHPLCLWSHLLQPLAAPTTPTFKALCLIAKENFLAVVGLYCFGAGYFYQEVS